MEKKSPTNETQVPVRYVKQPWNISSITRSLTLQETHILAEIMDAISDRVGELLSTSPDKDGKLLLFKDEDFDENGNVNIDIPLSSLTTRSDCYKQVEDVAMKLVDTNFKIETETDEEIFKFKMNMFVGAGSVVNKNNRRTGTLRFVMNKLQAKQYMDFSRYSRYIKAVVRNCKSVFTARIYWLITAYKDFGVYTLKYADLRKYLGFSVYNESTRKWEDTGKYQEYRLFKRRILNTADAELKQLAEEGNVDCYFDLEEIFGADPKTPEKFKFTIHKTEMGKLESMNLEHTKERIELEGKMKTAFGLSISDCKVILDLAGADRLDYLSQRIDEVKAYIDKMIVEGKKVNVKKYAIKSLRNALTEEVPKVEEVKTTPKQEPIEQPKVYSPTDADKERWSRVAKMLSNGLDEAFTLKADAEGAYLEAHGVNLSFEIFKNDIDTIIKKGFRIKQL